MLTQESRKGKLNILAYYSRALTPTEQRYPQIDKEMLAIVSAVEHFRVYLAEGVFTIKTDHKPLVSIFQNHCETVSQVGTTESDIAAVELQGGTHPWKGQPHALLVKTHSRL